LKLVFIFVEVFGAVRILFAQLVTTIWIKRVKVKYYIMTVLLHLMDALLLPLTAACYLYGAIPFSYVFTYLASGKRIYEAGSRNIGVANTFVVGGMIAGLLTVCSEISKVVVCIAAAYVLFAGSTDVVLLLVFSAFVGTQFSVFLKGRGSVGSTMQGFALLVLSPLTAIVFFVTIAVAYWLLKIKQGVPIIAEAILPVILLVTEQTVGWVLFGLGTALLFLLKYAIRRDDVEYLPWRGGRNRA
jgi:glycerol-3-phosphate acyltransferase PlsY